MNSATKKKIAIVLGLVFLIGALGWIRSTWKANNEVASRWSRETVELFASLPVQHAGRIKPIDKLAGLKLLTLNGKRKLELSEEHLIRSSEWLLDCLFFPDDAKTYNHFRVQNDAVLVAIGMDTKSGEAHKKSDRYNYNQLEPFRERLAEEAQRVVKIDPKERNPTQRQTLKLASDLRAFDELLGAIEPLRWHYTTSGTPRLDALFGQEFSSLSQVLSRGPEVVLLARDIRAGGDAESEEWKALDVLLAQLESVAQLSTKTIAFLLPARGMQDEETWWGVGEVLGASFQTDLQLDLSAQLRVLAQLEALEAAKNDPVAFYQALDVVHRDLVGQATAAGSYGTIEREVNLERRDPFTNALVMYLLAFLLLSIGWMTPGSKWLPRCAWAAVSIGLALGIWGITQRCIIRSRPPVVSLYDTVLFITSVCVLIALVAEFLTRTRVALLVSALLGVGGMFLAGRYELKEVISSEDTMASVVAVLDTNYYLAIHVTTVTMGYAGGLLAAALAHVWILGKLLRYRANDKKFYKTLTRMTYGVVCFSLLFAIFGTIMGGVWANDSWGRFWGWDPKENGALLICIWELLILHSRMGGYIRDRGFAVMTVLAGVVVSASWWGVNELGVGMHSYGFTSGVMVALFTYWGIEALVVGLSGLDAFMGKADSNSALAKEA